MCPNCGKPGPHFVPPSLGEKGFFICDELNVLTVAPSPPQAPATETETPNWYDLVKKSDRFTVTVDGNLVQDDDGPWVVRSDVDKAIAACSAAPRPAPSAAPAKLPVGSRVTHFTNPLEVGVVVAPPSDNTNDPPNDGYRIVMWQGYGRPCLEHVDEISMAETESKR